MSRRHLTKSGRFEVGKHRGFVWLAHAPSGSPAGGFSHLTVRTIRTALEGVERAESALSPADLALIDATRDPANDNQTAALLRLVAALGQAFGAGGWSR